MNEQNFRVNANEVTNMPNTEHGNYRRGFWIVLAIAAVLAIVASFLWWRFSQASNSAPWLSVFWPLGEDTRI